MSSAIISRYAHLFRFLFAVQKTFILRNETKKTSSLIDHYIQIFSDINLNIEDLMKAKGQLVKRGSVDGDGHIELYENSSDAATSNPQNPQNSNSAASTTTE